MNLSLVTINYNCSAATIEAVASFKKALSGVDYEFEIIVVDNNSQISDYNNLCNIDGIELIRSNINGGFAAANNIGFNASKGDYVMIINNDTVIKSDIFTPMIQFLAENPNIGAISPKIVYNSKPYHIQYGGYYCNDRYMFDIKSVLHGKRVDEVEDCLSTTDFAHGAAMMISRAALEKVKFMREDYFLYFEEIDFSIALRRAGYEIFYFPFSTVYHNASSTVGDNSEMKIYYNSRNRLFLALNNLKGCNRLIAIIIQLTFSFPKSVAKFIYKGKFALGKAYTLGVFDFIRGKRGAL